MKTFPIFCKEIALNVFIDLKPLILKDNFNDSDRLTILQCIESLKNGGVHSMPYDKVSIDCELAIKNKFKKGEIKIRLKLLFAVVCEDLNQHNILYSCEKIENPFN